MRIGILADIHGNAQALDAVLKDSNNKGINDFILLGDLFSKGPEPFEVFQLLEKCSILYNIRGNTEKWFFQTHLDHRKTALVHYGIKSFPCIHSYIKKMKNLSMCPVQGHNMLLTHYWPRNSISQELIDYLEEGNIQYIISAHTHIPLITNQKFSTPSPVIHWNPGSIGAPYDADCRSSYGILQLEDKLSFEVIRVAYDIEKEITVALNREIPFIEEYIEMIRSGSARGTHRT